MARVLDRKKIPPLDNPSGQFLHNWFSIVFNWIFGIIQGGSFHRNSSPMYFYLLCKLFLFCSSIFF